MNYQIDDFSYINFANKKTKEYVKQLGYRNTKQLLKSFIQSQDDQKMINFSKKTLFNVNKQQLRKVAREVQFLGYDQDYCMIFGVYGPRINQNSKSQLIFTLDQIIQESFYSNVKHQGQAKGPKKYSTNGISLVFFNNCSTKKRHRPSFSSKKQIPFESMKIDCFKQQVIKFIPLKNLIKINHIFLVFPSMLTKSWSYLTSFGIENGFYNTYFQYSDSIYQLVQYLGLLFEAQKIDPGVIYHDSQNNRNWKALYSGHQKSNSMNQFKSFQKMCQQISKDNLQNHSQFRYKKRLDQYQIDQNLQIPAILSLILNYLLQNHIQFQGIFRKVSGQRELIRLQNFIQNCQSKCSQNKKQILAQLQGYFTKLQVPIITSFLKKVFMEVQTPIISYQIYRKLTQLSLAEIEQIGQANFQIKSNHKNYEIIRMRPLNQTNNTSCVNTIAENSMEDHPKINFLQKVAYFEKLANQNIMIKTAPNQNLQNKNKISFKKVQNVRKNYCTEQAAQQRSDIFNFSQMKKSSPTQYNTFKKTIIFLNRIKKQQRFNLMSSSNLAICFNPCFFRSPQVDNAQLSIHEECLLNNKLVKILQKLIEIPEKFFVE